MSSLNETLERLVCINECEVILFSKVSQLLMNGAVPTVKCYLQVIKNMRWQVLFLLIYHDEDDVFFTRVPVELFLDIFEVEDFNEDDEFSPFESMIDLDEIKIIKKLIQLDMINTTQHHDYIKAAIRREPESYERKRLTRIFANRGYQSRSFKPRYL